MIEHRIASLIFFTFLPFCWVTAQCPTSDFTIPSTVCIDEQIQIQSSSAYDSTHWYFCPSSISNVSSSPSRISGLYSFKGSVISINQANKIGLSVIYGNVNRVDFSFFFSKDVSSTVLANSKNTFSFPQDVELINYQGIWYGFIANERNIGMSRLFLGEDIQEIESFDFISNSSPILNTISLTSVNTEYLQYLFAGKSSGGEIVRLNFSSGFASEPTQSSFLVPGVSKITGLSITQDCEDWVMFAVASEENKVLRLNFGDNLMNDPIIEEITLPSYTFTNPYRVDIIKDQGVFFLNVLQYRGDIVKINLGNSVLSNSAEYQVINTTGKNLESMVTVKEERGWHTFATSPVQSTRGLYRIDFVDECNQAVRSSTAENPAIAYAESGIYDITMESYNAGLSSSVTKQVVVEDNIAPEVNFSVPVGYCRATNLEFSGSSTDIIQSWQWDFGDNSPPVSGQEVTHQYTTPGTYFVTLEVESANGCGNRLTKEITIYEPPIPSFTVPTGQVCSNGSVTFTNTTDTRGAESLITYRWFVTDPSNTETLVSEEANPAITFATGGTHTVRLEAGIPGCTETFEQTIDILQGPTVSFTVPTVCQSNVVTFENQTVGAGITGYFWEFGDGGTYSSVTADNPTYTFDTPGTYPVTLRVTNALGCQNVYRQDVTVYAQPSVSFLSEVACAGSPTQFTDASTAGANANVSAWQWDFGDGIGTASTRNPTYAYPQAGTYDVKLITTSTAGCVDSTVQTVTVQSAVDVGFAAVRQCPTEARPLNVLLSDTSVAAAGETIDRWFWTVNGENFVSAEVEYAFPAPGDCPVSLTVFTTSGCNATVQRIVSVTTSPAVAFTTVGSCTGEPVAFRGEIDAPGWGELSYAWEFVGPNGEEAGTAATANPEVVFEAPGSYNVTLRVQTDGGCTFTTTRPVTIAATPVAAFAPSASYGGTPLEVTFANDTTDATTYVWDFGGVGTSEEAEPTFTFTEVGTYVVTLTATNAAGCESTTQQTVEVVLPVQDLRLDDFTVADSPTGDGQQLVLTLSNRGTRVASGVMVTVDLDETLTVEERRAEPLLPGQTVTYVTKFRLPTVQRNQQRPLRYLCARIAATDADFTEAQLDNNRNCLSLNEQLNVEPPFPNPAHEQLRVSVILPAKPRRYHCACSTKTAGWCARTGRKPRWPD